MKLDKCNAYTAKEILGYSRRKSYVSAAREEETSLQLNYRSPPIRKRDEPMKIQNRENEEKVSDTHRQETEVATDREKVGEGAIRKRRTQEEIAFK